jgi:heme/copper-type cytochrome/quinol oxidase subunit 3
MYVVIEVMGFSALFVPLMASNLAVYLVEPSVVQVYTILMSTAILLSSGFFANIAVWALFTGQTYVWLISQFICILSLMSFVLIEWHEVKVSTPAFNTSCLHSSILCLEAS